MDAPARARGTGHAGTECLGSSTAWAAESSRGHPGRQEIGEYEAGALHDFAGFDGDLVAKHRTRVRERMKLAVFAAGVHRSGQVREQRFVERAPCELRR